MTEAIEPTDVFNRLHKAINDLDVAIEERLGEESAMKAFAERVDFAKYLQTKYADYDTCVAYHALINSTPTTEPMPGRAAVTKQDFPGEDSAETFIRNLRRKFNV